MPIFVPLCSLRAKLSVASERPLTSRHGVLSPSRTVCEASNRPLVSCAQRLSLATTTLSDAQRAMPSDRRVGNCRQADSG